MYRIWYSTESFRDFIIDNTELKNMNIETRKLYESDANNKRNFHTLPEHIKKLIYLDCHDIIIEKDFEPILAIEDTKEAGTGHNSFQRFARLAAAAEHNVPSIYIFPEAKIILRKGCNPRWDRINPLIFKALEKLMQIYKIPNLLFYYPSSFRSSGGDPLIADFFKQGGLDLSLNDDFSACPNETDVEMRKMFDLINTVIKYTENYGVIEAKEKLLLNRKISERVEYMQKERFRKTTSAVDGSPVTSTVTVPTEYLINYLSTYEDSDYKIGELLNSREETIIYQADSKFRGDPYTGALAGLDYLLCRIGKSFEERDKNLVLCWGKIEEDHINKTLVINRKNTTASIQDFFKKVQNSDKNNLADKKFHQLKNYEIPRYYMQARYGTMYTKSKEIRIYSYFADAILFSDGSLWRDG